MAAEFVTQLPLLVPGSAVLPVGTAPSGKEQQNTLISGAPPTLMCKELTTVSCQNDQLQEEEEEQQANHVFDVRNSVSQLCNLSDALSDFRRCYEELQQQIDFVKSSIDAQLAQKPMNANLGHTEIEPISQSLAIVSYDGTQLQGPKKTPTADQGLSEIESISKSMRGRGLRKYVVTHFSDIPKLRAELPAALKLAPYPARLVLSSCGRVFQHGRNMLLAVTTTMKAVQAIVLILESFLLMGIDGNKNKIAAAAVKKEAQSNARKWIKRLKDEGGVDKAVEIDARALLLFISCFGIACSFKNKDVTSLIQRANAMEISGALRNSAFLRAKIPALIEWMIRRNKELDAVNIVAVFALENQFPPQTMLTSFLKKSNETWAKSRGAAHGCIAEVNEANKKKLADLKCVLKFLENHNLDPTKVLTEWGINENISSLEKEIAVSDKTLEKEQQQLNLKRKADEAEVQNKLKQTRVSDYNNTVTEETPNGGITARLTSNTYPQNSESPPLPPPAIAASNGTQSQTLQKLMIANLGHTEIGPISQPLAVGSSDGIQLLQPKKAPTADPALSEIELICKSLNSLGLRNYVITHISDIPKLRAEIPAALKLAPNPGRLVLNSFGKFYLQGRKTLTADTPIKKAVQAMILILESFLLMGGAGDENKIGAAVKKGAECEAEDWVKRLNDEGGVDKAVEIDARALLLFIGCFCIPVSLQHIINLIQGSKAMEISGALRNSAFLLAKFPEMMEWMIERNKELEAINIVAVFGQEKQYPPQTMVTSFLKKSNDTWARSRGAAHGCIVEVNEANKKKLADLKCVLKCLENYNLDTEWGIQENIYSLEREIAVSDKTLEKEQLMKLKRKADEGEVSNKLKQTPNGGITANEVQLPTTTGYDYGSGCRDGLIFARQLHSTENSSGAGMIHGQMNSNVRQWPLTSYAVENSSGAGFPLHMNNSFHHFHASPPFPHSGVGFGDGSLAGGSHAAGMSNDSLPYRWQGQAAVAREERFVDAVPESFPGLLNLSPSLGVSGQKSSDIYQFADAVL